MNKKFKVKAVYLLTKKTHTITLIAKDKSGVIEQLVKSEYLEPFEIEEILDPPTSEQIQYAKSMDIDIPAGASTEDFYALIFKKKSGDSDPHPDLIEYGIDKGIYFSIYRGKKDLYNIIFHHLSGEDKIAFFAFSIYRWLSEDRQSNLDKHRYKEVFYEFARQQLNNERFVKSLGKYSGSDLRFFGILIADGWELNGGSIDTIAYKTCVEFLSLKFGIQKTKVKRLESSSNSLRL